MTMKRADSGLSLAHSELAESFPVLFEICGRVVVDLVLLQKSVHLHPRLEAKQPPKLCGGKRARPICFERQALDRGTTQVLPPGFESLGDVFRQFQRNLHRRTSFNSLSQDALSPWHPVRQRHFAERVSTMLSICGRRLSRAKPADRSEERRVGKECRSR